MLTHMTPEPAPVVLKAPRWVRAAIGISLGIATAALLCVGSVLIFNPVFADGRLWNAAAVFGLFLSAAGVVVALLIFARQAADSKKAESITHQHLHRIEIKQNALRMIFARHLRTPEGIDPDAVESTANAADAAEAERAGTPVVIGNGEGRLLSADKVPLSVLADLVRGWREQAELKDRDGAWTVANLVGAYRPSGKGNHPWFLTFEKPDGSTRVWRMYRGGRSRTSPFVEDVTPTKEVS